MGAAGAPNSDDPYGSLDPSGGGNFILDAKRRRRWRCGLAVERWATKARPLSCRKLSAPGSNENYNLLGVLPDETKEIMPLAFERCHDQVDGE